MSRAQGCFCDGPWYGEQCEHYWKDAEAIFVIYQVVFALGYGSFLAAVSQKSLALWRIGGCGANQKTLNICMWLLYAALRCVVTVDPSGVREWYSASLKDCIWQAKPPVSSACAAELVGGCCDRTLGDAFLFCTGGLVMRMFVQIQVCARLISCGFFTIRDCCRLSSTRQRGWCCASWMR